MKTKTPKPAPGDIWETSDGGLVLVAGMDGSHVTFCSVAIRRDGSVVAHPRGRKAERVLLPKFACGRYVGVAKARTVAS
ncbi:hypothetical protein OS965_02110 [Streptomyces sp. H27-G5]|uniref:hypothetical protein n=1 Tax=Streptomyces sp. H27-G5 TaxID=2996698 RepID=UPI002271B813|nr:hypothetical protein [Streptomyces sp. H27-G5]MCY0916969.1 hypothetical protein [Streptomyces sp. H27-G5]